MDAENHIEIDLTKYPFSKEVLGEIHENRWVKNQWPLVYIIQNDSKKLAYVGESTNAKNRINNHLANEQRTILNTITLIGSSRFNKSATLDIESKLIEYLSAETTFTLQNGNGGLSSGHNYYEKPYYQELFTEIWSRLREEKIVTKSLKEIQNSDLFKYSPYKALSPDQNNSVIEILRALVSGNNQSIFVEGRAGTGKTILATYLIKLLNSGLPEEDELEEMEGSKLLEYELLSEFHNKFKKPKIALVVPMTSLRNSLKTVFRAIGGLSPNMVIGPADAVKEHYDLLIVDESHRLAQRKNIPNYGSFDAVNRKLGLGNEGTQLDWILRNSSNQLFFYDDAQSIKPSDIPKEKFDELKKTSLPPIKLVSQMRVSAGMDYINFVDCMLKCKPTMHLDVPESYDFVHFTSFADFYEAITKKEQELGLCRMIAGYSWPWISKTDKTLFDIEIEDFSLQWNNTHVDWINSANPKIEVGCIHTTQGYDLNYAGIIFGHEITYNKDLNRIEIIGQNYFDRNGSAGIKDPEKLKEYIINIYKTIMYRGIKGTYIYACDKNLRAYFSEIIKTISKEIRRPKLIPFDQVNPYDNAIPLYDVQVAAGNFKVSIPYEELEWIEKPANIRIHDGDFVCQVVGESMNTIIPNGAYCLFRKDLGGSRNGKIVLVRSSDIQDFDFGKGYTVKRYKSEKIFSEHGWQHESITLEPLSTDDSFEKIKLQAEDLVDFEVIGIFEAILYT